MVASLVFAQDFAKQGVVELGGTVSFSSSTSVNNGETADESTTNFSFTPIVGYFFIDNFELALFPRYQSTSYADKTSSNFAIFLMPAYHFSTGGNIYPFIAGAIGYNTYTSTSDNTYSGISFGGLAGIKMQVAKGAIINFGVNYFMFTYNPEDWDGDRNGNNDLEISAGIGIFLGR
jgi:hypothetical protein